MSALPEWETVRNTLRNHPEVVHGNGGDEQVVQAAENTLGVSLPPSYRQFLLSFGWAEIAEEPIFGLGADLPEPYMDVVVKTLDERAIIDLPECLIPVYQTGWGNLVCLCTRSLGEQECPVVFLRLCPYASAYTVADSFIDFLQACLRYGADAVSEDLFAEGDPSAVGELEPITWREHRLLHKEEAKRLFARNPFCRAVEFRWYDVVGEPWPSNASMLQREARAFLQGHRWCRSVRSLTLISRIEGVVGLFYAEIDPEPSSGADEAIWVIVGDLPPAYLDIPSVPTPREAVEAYISLLEEWVEAVTEGKPLDDLLPVYSCFDWVLVPPTMRYAKMLRARLPLLRKWRDGL